MRRYLLSTFLFVLPAFANAQNYIPLNGYEGAGVVVNMDVLSGSSAGAPAVASQNLPPVLAPLPPQKPIVLRPPQKSFTAPEEAAPEAKAPLLDKTPFIAPAPLAREPVAPEPEAEPDTNSKRQVLGSLHDAPEDETPALPAPAPQMDSSSNTPDEMAPMAPALPSPIMGKPGESLQSSGQSLGNTSAPVSDTVKTDDNFEAYRLFFDPSSDVLKPSETAVLDKVAGKLSADPALRLQVRAYANGTPDNAGAARRLSLTRALKVRDYLTQKNIATTHLNIRAFGTGSAEMGDQPGSNSAPPDRVDVIFSK